MINFIRNIKVKKYLNYFKSEYPNTYVYLSGSKFKSNKERYFYIKTLYTFYKNINNLRKRVKFFDYKYNEYKDCVEIDIDITFETLNYNTKFDIKCEFVLEELSISDKIKIHNKRFKNGIKIEKNNLDKKILEELENKIYFQVDISYALLIKRLYSQKHYSNYNYQSNYKQSYYGETKTKANKVDKNFERFKKLVLNLKERKRQIDSMYKNDPNYSTLVNEYNTGVRRWRSMKEKYNY